MSSRDDRPTTGRLTLRAGEDETGAALVLVGGSMLVLTMLALTALAFTVTSQRFSRYDQDYTAAMTATQSGIDDYISRLNRLDTYGQTVDCSNQALKGPMDASKNTCGYTTATPAGWLPVTPGETGAKDAYFHYSVDSTTSVTQGTIMVTSTGRVNGVYRTIEVAVGKGGSTDYVYYTDYEDADPSNVQAYKPGGANSKSTGGASYTECGSTGYANANYWYEGRSHCVEIQFISGDTLDGTVFSNDAILSNGATFKTGVLTANPPCANATATSSTWNQCLRSGSTANFNGVRPQLSGARWERLQSA